MISAKMKDRPITGWIGREKDDTSCSCAISLSGGINDEYFHMGYNYKSCSCAFTGSGGISIFTWDIT